MSDSFDKARTAMAEIDLDWRDIGAAATLLTRVPVPVPVNHAKAGERGAATAWAFPIVGAVLGLLAGIVGWVLMAVGVPSGMAAAGVLGALVLATGGLHEDGLADCADGFGGGTTPERRLEIMRDSRVGAFGVLALVVAGLARWGGIEALLSDGQVWVFAGIGAVSRLPMALVMFAMPLARRDGLSAHVGLVTAPVAAVAGLVTLVLALLFTGWAGLALLLVAGLSALPVCLLAWTRIEGQTGDVLGCVQQMAEIAALATAAAILL